MFRKARLVFQGGGAYKAIADHFCRTDVEMAGVAGASIGALDAAPIARHLVASSGIPILYPLAEIGRESYWDGDFLPQSPLRDLLHVLSSLPELGVGVLKWPLPAQTSDRGKRWK